MKRYEEYKDSGIECIGEIPKEWDRTKLKNLLSIPITDGPHETPELLDDGVPFISAEAVKNLKIDFNLKRGYISFAEHQRFCQKCKPQYGDIFMIKSGATTGNIAMVDTYEEFSIWSPLALIRSNAQLVSNQYLFYFLQSKAFRFQVELFWSYGTQQNIGMGVLGNLYVSYPSLLTQQSIVNYLDYKTSAIDSLIVDKQKLIDLLKEKRQVIISEAVTKGLDKTTKLKDSGIEWIGEIPEGWAMSKIKYVTSKVGSGKTPRGGNEVYVNEGIIFIRSQNVYDMGLLLDDVAYITDEMDEELSNTRLEYEDILLNITGASIGRCCVWKEPNCRANVNQHVCIIRTSKTVLAEYLHLVLVSFVGKTLIDICQSGANRQGLNFEEIANFYFPLPTAYEQSEIVFYLDQKTSAIDTLITDITTQIDKLKEYRHSVISEAVTGKVAI